MKTMSKSLKSPKSSSPPVARMPTAKPLPSASELSELREEASSLLQSGLFESAEVLCSLVLSRIPAISIRALSAAGAGHIGATITAERAPFLEIMADSLVSRLQHKRASVLFIYAFDALTGRGWILNQLSMRNDKYHNESAFAPNPVDSKMCVRLVFKLAQCLVELKDIGAAVRALESIPLQLRPIRVTVLLGKLYMESGSKRQAIICYKSVLSVYPSSSEAVQILVDLGVSHSEISATAGWNITSKQPNEESSSDQIQRRPLHSMVADVMPRLARALEDRVRWKIHDAECEMKKLSSEYPGNAFLLSMLGECMSCRLDAGSPHNCESIMATFQAARSSDKYALRNMDSFAAFLALIGASKELGMLANDLFSLRSAENVSQSRGAVSIVPIYPQSTPAAEAWVAAAMYSYSKKDFGRALELIEKALKVRNLIPYSLGFRMKGVILLAADRLEESVVAFLQSNYTSKHIYTYNGLVSAYERLEKRNEAVVVAKELILHMPLFTDAFVVAGVVLSNTPNGTQDAIKCYLRALKIDPTNEGAMEKMATELCKIGKMEEAVQCINQIVQRKPSNVLLTRLAQVLRKSGQYYPAIDCLNDALFLLAAAEDGGGGKRDGDSEIVSRVADIADEFDALERSMRGEDEGQEEEEALAMEGEEEEAFEESAGGFEYQMRRDSGGNDSRISNPEDYSY